MGLTGPGGHRETLLETLARVRLRITDKHAKFTSSVIEQERR